MSLSKSIWPDGSGATSPRLGLPKATRAWPTAFSAGTLCAFVLAAFAEAQQTAPEASSNAYFSEVVQSIESANAADARLDPKFENGGLAERLREKLLRRRANAAPLDPARLAGRPLAEEVPPGAPLPPMAGAIRATEGAILELYKNRLDDGAVRMAEFTGPGGLAIDAPLGGDPSLAPDPSVHFISFHVLPAVLGGEDDKPFLMNLSGATMAFQIHPNRTVGRTAELFVLDGDLQAKELRWLGTGYYIHLKADGSSLLGHRFTVRIDSAEGEWDFFINGSLRYAGLGLGRSRARCWMHNPSSSRAEIGGLSATSYNPLFADADVDGIEDSQEIALGFDPTRNDRYELDEKGEFTNLERFAARRHRYRPPSEASRLMRQLGAADQPGVDAEEGGRP